MNDIEYWKDISQYENLYQISNLGRIKRLSRIIITKNKIKRVIKEKMLSQSFDGSGYKKVTLTKNGNENTELVHRLVCLTFLGENKNKPQVNHIDGNKSNNKLKNLEWVTRSQNIKHAYTNKLLDKQLGSSHGMSKLTEEKVSNIKKLLEKKIKLKDIAIKYNVDPSTISYIKNNKTWKHVK